MSNAILDTTRHRELFNPYYVEAPVHVIGAGALGSWIALALSKLGVEYITVWDFDKIEEHNVSNQAYSVWDVNNPKTSAIADLIKNNVGNEIKIVNERFTNQRLAGVVFLMVDSMEVRRQIWENSIKMKSAVKLLVEARMGLDIGRIYNVEPMNTEHIRQYESNYSYNDDEADESACGASQTVITTATGIASWCVRQLINWHNNTRLDNEILIDFKNNNIISSEW